MRGLVIAVTALALGGGAALADPSPYAELEGRQVKALSAEETDELLAGRGLGMALAAELNRYPGPAHVIELAPLLDLSPQQEAETRRLFERMRSEAVPLGEAIIAGEAELDALFAAAAAEEAAVGALVREIARLRGELRLVHLKHHLAMRELLRPDQVAAYVAARGYSVEHGGHHGAHGHGG